MGEQSHRWRWSLALPHALFGLRINGAFDLPLGSGAALPWLLVMTLMKGVSAVLQNSLRGVYQHQQVRQT